MYVYFIGTGITKGHQVKIGVAKDVEKRLKGMQTGNPHKLIILAKIPCDSRRHALHLEATLHERFKKDRMTGEWFRGHISFNKLFD